VKEPIELRNAPDRAKALLLRAPAMTPSRLTQAEQRELIRAALAGNPTLPDLRIARAIGCAATTVARVRRSSPVGAPDATIREQAAGCAWLIPRDRCQRWYHAGSFAADGHAIGGTTADNEQFSSSRF
jgi:hypothetical protein